MKIIPKLSELININDFGELALSNIDEYICKIAIGGIKEVEVNREQMFLITSFMIMSCDGVNKVNTFEVWKALSEGRVNKCMGLKLKLSK